MFKCKDCKFIESKKYYVLDDKTYYNCSITTNGAADSEVNPNMNCCNYFKPIYLLEALKIVFKTVIGWFR